MPARSASPRNWARPARARSSSSAARRWFTKRGGEMGRALVGISGWRYEPWRGVFYPPGLAQHRELEYASRQLPTIEINGTHYSLQRPECFDAWRAATPPGFVFA